MDYTITPLIIELYDDVLTLWEQSEGVGLLKNPAAPSMIITWERTWGKIFSQYLRAYLACGYRKKALT